ncbi:MAG: hypothetical protein SGPRY_006093 [Prymnesium sp.]
MSGSPFAHDRPFWKLSASPLPPLPIDHATSARMPLPSPSLSAPPLPHEPTPSPGPSPGLMCQPSHEPPYAPPASGSAPPGCHVSDSVLRLLDQDTSAFALRPGAFSLTSLVHEVFDLASAQLSSTTKAQTSAWKHWEAWCALNRTPPWRLCRPVSDAEFHREAVLQAGFLRFTHVRQSARPRGHRAPALPSSADKALRHVRRMHKDRNYEMVASTLVAQQLRRMHHEYVQRYPVSDLIPRRKEPFTREILVDVILKAPEGFDLGFFSLRWIAPARGILCAPSLPLLPKQGFEKGSKSDPFDMVWGENLVWLSFQPDEPLCAFSALADVELYDPRFPRRPTPLLLPCSLLMTPILVAQCPHFLGHDAAASGCFSCGNPGSVPLATDESLRIYARLEASKYASFLNRAMAARVATAQPSSPSPAPLGVSSPRLVADAASRRVRQGSLPASQAQASPPGRGRGRRAAPSPRRPPVPVASPRRGRPPVASGGRRRRPVRPSAARAPSPSRHPRCRYSGPTVDAGSTSGVGRLDQRFPDDLSQHTTYWGREPPEQARAFLVVTLLPAPRTTRRRAVYLTKRDSNFRRQIFCASWSICAIDFLLLSFFGKGEIGRIKDASRLGTASIAFCLLISNLLVSSSDLCSAAIYFQSHMMLQYLGDEDEGRKLLLCGLLHLEVVFAIVRTSANLSID